VFSTSFILLLLLRLYPRCVSDVLKSSSSSSVCISGSEGITSYLFSIIAQIWSALRILFRISSAVIFS